MASAASSICLFCQHRTSLLLTLLPKPVPQQPPVRSMARMERRRPSRMTLSPTVARQTDGSAPDRRTARKSKNSPFGGMNMTSPRITRPPNSRSQAEILRSSRGGAWRQRDEEGKESAPTYHALKMQKALGTVSYGHRNAVKARIQEIDSFDDFSLLPLVRDAVGPQVLRGSQVVVPSPVQRLAIPALLDRPDGRRREAPAASSSSSSGRRQMDQFLIAAETGSGKTLAYLLPILDAVKRAEAVDVEEEARRRAADEERKRSDPYFVEPPPLDGRPHPTAGRPRAIILVPTAELVSQVAAVAKALSHVVKYRSAAISAAYSPRVIRNRLFSPSGIDVVVSTPHLLSSICESDPNVLSRVTHLVVDEADSLLDRSFAATTTSIIDRSTPSLRQLILCSATIPRSLDAFLADRFPRMRRLVTPNLHAVPRRVQLGVVDVDKIQYRGNRLLACADTIWTIGKAGPGPDVDGDGDAAGADSFALKRLIVFVNERETTAEVASYLQSKGIDAVALSRDTPEQRQSELLSAFTLAPTKPLPTPSPPPISSSSSSSSSSSFVSVAAATAAAGGAAAATTAPPPAPRPPPPMNFSPAHVSPSSSHSGRRLPNTKVLVTTDLGSRGIDTLAVRHVILYDVPHTTVDFIHRLGRTGRMGRRGRGVVLVGKGDRRDVVREVREGMFRGQALI